MRRVVAANPGPHTYHGTCTYIVGRGRVAVVDPGPDDAAHVAAVRAALRPDERISHIVVTHTHTDHSPAARRLQQLTGAPIYGFGPQARTDDPDPTRVVFSDPDLDPDPSGVSPPRGGDSDFRADVQVVDASLLEGDGWTLQCVHTPGHATNHLCYGLKEDGCLFTGDQVMGWATTVVSPPDGKLSEYMDSLETLLTRHSDTRYLPGHGPPIDQPHLLVQALLRHRQSRNEQLLSLLANGSASIAEIVPVLYATVNRQLWPAAAASVYAHLLYLEDLGSIEADDGPKVLRASRVRIVG